ncbi:MAG TPA: urate hydroxylase PuuD [Gaiellaceae bacterium]|nr:urate hydroxylase PuuD [Gaiellaceae bacterium]
MTATLLAPYANEWLDAALRYLHVVAAIAWIGASFYFIALDLHLRPPERREDAERGVGGEVWEIHGGGFYRIEKFKLTPKRLPEPLYWFKWEAYTTWLSGFGLFVVLYYLNANTYLVDRSVRALSPGAAVGISIGLLVAAWVVYDLLCRAVASDAVVGVVVLGLTVLAAWGSTELFAARAAWLQIGAMLGTIMAANVFFVIIPAHWELVRAKEAGREPDARWAVRGKQRSVHNNYLTLPVLVAMLSNHWGFLYGHTWSWAILVSLMTTLAIVRHYFNLRHRGWNAWPILVAGAGVLALLGWLIRPQSTPVAASAVPVSFARVQAIVANRCAPCHSMQPTQPGFDAPPKGIAFDTAQEIVARAQLIDQWAVQSHAMPLGNLTGMTQAERDEVGAWVAQGAHR